MQGSHGIGHPGLGKASLPDQNMLINPLPERCRRRLCSCPVALVAATKIPFKATKIDESRTQLVAARKRPRKRVCTSRPHGHIIGKDTHSPRARRTTGPESCHTTCAPHAPAAQDHSYRTAPYTLVCFAPGAVDGVVDDAQMHGSLLLLKSAEMACCLARALVGRPARAHYGPGCQQEKPTRGKNTKTG